MSRKYPMVKRNRLYPYNRWFKKGILILRHGSDFLCDSAAIAQQLRNEANIRRVRISIFKKTMKNKKIVVFVNWTQLMGVKL